MSGILPNVANGAVDPSATTHAFNPTNVPAVGTLIKYFAQGCKMQISPEVMNSILSEIMCVVDGSGRKYDAGSLCNMSLSIQSMIDTAIANAVNNISSPTAYATCATIPPGNPVNGDYWLDQTSGFNILKRWVAANNVWAAVSPVIGPSTVICKNCARPQVYFNCGSAYVELIGGGSGTGTLNNQLFYSPTTGIPFVVPVGVNSINFKIWGGGGSGGGGIDHATTTILGGGAGFVMGIIAVVPGETLTIKVAGGGQLGLVNGSSQYVAGGGGGFSAIYRGSTLLAIAAGGGGAGSISNSLRFAGTGFGGGTGSSNGLGGNGGPGGGLIGTAGGNPPAGGSSTGGGGGSQSSGGYAGTQNSSPGLAFAGGVGSIVLGGEVQVGGVNGGGNVAINNGYVGVGGGGGAGFFGGGGGGGGFQSPACGPGGGGGGSSHVDSTITGVQILAGASVVPGASSDPDYHSGVGIGGTGPTGPGGRGEVYLTW